MDRDRQLLVILDAARKLLESIDKDPPAPKMLKSNVEYLSRKAKSLFDAKSKLGNSLFTETLDVEHPDFLSDCRGVLTGLISKLE